MIARLRFHHAHMPCRRIEVFIKKKMIITANPQSKNVIEMHYLRGLLLNFNER
jgi:hypothetical protein